MRLATRDFGNSFWELPRVSLAVCDMKGTLAPKVIPWWSTPAAGPEA